MGGWAFSYFDKRYHYGFLMPGNDCDDRYWSMIFFSRLVPSENDNLSNVSTSYVPSPSRPIGISPRQDFLDGILRQSRSWGGRALIGCLEFPTAGKAEAQSSLVVRQVKRVSRQSYQKHLPHALPGLINSSRKIAREALRNTNFPGPRRSSTANTSIRSPKANFPLTNPSQPTFPPTNTPTHRKYGDQRRIPSLR